MLKILCNLLVLRKPVRCYNQFKGEPKKTDTFIDQKYWHKYANGSKIGFFCNQRVVSRTSARQFWIDKDYFTFLSILYNLQSCNIA